jgi:dTDP-4-dehydrorhamnose reductase
VEDDPPDPLSPYGESKLQGERHVQALAPDHLIIRTQWLFGANGRNLVSTIVRAARGGRPLRIITDQWGAPTYAPDLAAAIWAGLDLPGGIYHATNDGVASWYDVARCALDAAGLGAVQVTPITAAEWDSPTVRPAYAVLSNAKWIAAGMTPLRPWQEAVTEFVKGM